MKWTDEDLSRLCAGDHPAAEVLRMDIAGDPDLAARWRRMRAVVVGLDALPPLGAAPPLDARVMEVGAAAYAPPKRAWPAVFAMAAAVCAAAGVGWWSAQAPADVALVRGTQVVSGDLSVWIPGGRVHVDGRALVSVEPIDDAVRESGQEVPMSAKNLAAAAGGVALTVAVYEGCATVRAGDGVVSEVRPGDRVSIQVGGAGQLGGGSDIDSILRGAPDDSALATARADRLDRRISELEEENAQLRFEAALARGQVASHQGEAQPWPDDVPDVLRPDGFADLVEERVAQIPDARLVHVDCSEFPCFGIVQSMAEGDDWEDALSEISAPVPDLDIPMAVQGWGMESQSSEEGPPTRLYAFSMVPGADRNDAVEQRTRYRVQTGLEDLAEMMPEGDGGPTIDEDVDER